MTWLEKRKVFQDRYDKLTQENFQAIITELNKSVASYVSKAGISQDSNNNPDFNRITTLINKAESIKQQFIQLNDDIINEIQDNALKSNLSGMLTENGELQSHIKQLEKIKDEMKVDVDSAIARDALLRSKKSDISRHSLFLLDRPVRKGLLPYLWVLTILFIGVGLVIFKMTMPAVAVGATIATQSSFMESVMGFFMDKRILISLLISALIVIIFLALKIGGVFGKSN